MTAARVIEADESSLFVCKRCGIGTRHKRIYWRRPFPLGYLARHKWIEGWICPECGMRIRVRPIEGPPAVGTEPGRDGGRTDTTTNGEENE